MARPAEGNHERLQNVYCAVENDIYFSSLLGRTISTIPARAHWVCRAGGQWQRSSMAAQKRASIRICGMTESISTTSGC